MTPEKIKNLPRMTKELRESLRGKYRHAEAFCHMLYISDDGRHMEWIWNSRDGVTPFCISSVTGKAMNHSYFGEDRFDPDYKPQPGDRIFVDCTPEMVKDSAREFVRKYWDDPKYPISKMYDTQAEAEQKFVSEWSKPGSPHVLTVGGIEGGEKGNG